MWFFKIASLQLVDSAFLPRCFCRTWSAHSSCTNGICVSSGIGRQFSSTCWQIFLRTRPCTGTVGWELTLSPVVSRRISTSLAKTSPSCLLSVSRCKRASRQYIRLDHFSVVTWTRARPDSGLRVRSSLRSSKQRGRVESDFYNMRFSSFRLPPAKRVGCDSFRWIQHIWYCHLKWLGTLIHPI